MFSLVLSAPKTNWSIFGVKGTRRSKGNFSPAFNLGGRLRFAETLDQQHPMSTKSVVLSQMKDIKITSLRVIPTVTLYWNIFVTNSDILSALRSLDFIRIILSSSSLLLVRGPAVTTVIYQAKLIQTDSRYAWFKIISDARASPDA